LHEFIDLGITEASFSQDLGRMLAQQGRMAPHVAGSSVDVERGAEYLDRPADWVGQVSDHVQRLHLRLGQSRLDVVDRACGRSCDTGLLDPVAG
jgi:hypothetical protein